MNSVANLVGHALFRQSVPQWCHHAAILSICTCKSMGFRDCLSDFQYFVIDSGKRFSPQFYKITEYCLWNNSITCLLGQPIEYGHKPQCPIFQLDRLHRLVLFSVLHWVFVTRTRFVFLNTIFFDTFNFLQVRRANILFILSDGKSVCCNAATGKEDFNADFTVCIYC